ncbi:antitermination regulator [Modestobacter sp. VKM Ac-2676]|nr:antitermination regulator [Modestobacter sp. VKM Ac-2676]
MSPADNPLSDTTSLVSDTARAALERLGSITLRDQSMESLLQTVVDLMTEILPGHPQASVSLVLHDKPMTTSASGRLAVELDESQFGRGYGPCLHAAATGELTEITDNRTEQRWPDYARRALEQGCGSSLSVPLHLEEPGLVGALNMYAREPHGFDDAAQAAATQVAPYAAVAVANLFAYRSAQERAENLQAALESRAVIDQAKGVLMERHKFTADQAFQALAAVSMHTNTRVREIAERLVTTGEFDLRSLPGR